MLIISTSGPVIAFFCYSRCKSFYSSICTPTRLSANGMSHAFAFPAEAGPHFTDPGGMEGWVDLVDITIPMRFTRPKIVTHPSTNRAQRWLTSLIRITILTTTPRRQLNSQRWKQNVRLWGAETECGNLDFNFKMTFQKSHLEWQ